jgi:broad specificity phosphatase PhoE
VTVTRWYLVRHAPVIGAEHLLYATHDEPADCSDVAAEQHYGRWHGRTRDELAAMRGDGPRHKFWMTTADDQPPEGESFRTVAARVSDALDALTLRFAGHSIVAVTHGGAIRAALAHALGLDLDRALTISVENLSTTRIDHVAGEGLGGDWRTVFVNRRPGG